MERTMMEQAGRKVATRHHTTQDQLEAVCRLLAHQIDGYLAELDECPGTIRLRQLAGDLRHAGGETGESRVLRLVPQGRSGA